MELDQKALAAQAWRDLELSADATGAMEVARVTLPIEKVRALVSERRASLPSDDEVGRVCERLEDGAREIDNDGTPSQAGPLPDELREAAALIQSQAAELAAVKADLIAAWNAFGPSGARGKPPAFDVADLDHLAISAEGGLPEQIMALEDRAERAEAALADIAEMTDADDPESYRCDDREGCLDAARRAARRAHSKDGGEQ